MFAVSFMHQSDEAQRIVGQGVYTTKHQDNLILNPNQFAI